MDDDEIKTLFSNFNPSLSSDFRFIKRLEERMNSVEIIRRHSSTLLARHRKAMVAAAMAGFIVGLLFSLAIPYFYRIVEECRLSFPSSSLLQGVADYFILLIWLAIGSASVCVSLNTYDLSLFLLAKRNKAPA